MATDHFLVPRLFKVGRPLLKVPSWADTAWINWPAVAALVITVLFGALGSGLIGDSSNYWGFIVGETWILAALLYLLGVWVSLRIGGDVRRLLGFSRVSVSGPPSDLALDIASEARL
jgi:hypothetical protein